MLLFRHMTSGDRGDAFELFRELLLNDEFFDDSRAAYALPAADRIAVEARIGTALTLFVERPDYGFVWMAYENEAAVGCAAVAYAISVPAGAVTASVDHLVMAPGQRRRGIGTEMLEALIASLRAFGVARLDVAVHVANGAGLEFYTSLGFLPTNEGRLSLVV